MRILLATLILGIGGGSAWAQQSDDGDRGSVSVAIVNRSGTTVRLQLMYEGQSSEKRHVVDGRGHSFYWTGIGQDAGRDGTLKILSADQDLDILLHWNRPLDRLDLNYRSVHRRYRYYLRMNMRGYYLDGPYGSGFDPEQTQGSIEVRSMDRE